MKKILSVAAAVFAAVTSVAVLCSCAEVQNAGNQIVSNAKDYLKSEAGVSGDVSSIRDNAVSYISEELGLNNNANKNLEGTWKTDKGEGDWQWTFDGINKCTLSSKQEDSASEGTYSVNDDGKTVDIALNSWGETITFTYKLRQTLSDQYLDLSSDTQAFNLIKKK